MPVFDVEAKIRQARTSVPQFIREPLRQILLFEACLAPADAEKALEELMSSPTFLATVDHVIEQATPALVELAQVAVKHGATIEA